MTLPGVRQALVLSCVLWMLYTCTAGLIDPKTCDTVHGWTAHGSHCYKKMETTNGWLGARYDCLLERADLVSITTEDEEIFVKEQMGDKPFWIGLSNLKCNGDWCDSSGEEKLTWSDTAVTSTHANWNSRQDGSANVESCAYVNQGAYFTSQPGKWRHGSCRSSLAYMCKRLANDCPDGWPCSFKDFGYSYSRVETSFCDSGEFLYKDSCYHFEGTRKIWQAAEDFCKNKGGHLASVHSHGDRQFLTDHRREANAMYSWLGLKENNGKLEWSDGSAADDVPSSLSTSSSYDCSKLADDGKIVIEDCDDLRPSICQKGKARHSLSVLPAPTSASGSIKTCDARIGWTLHGSHCYKKMETPNGWLGARYDCLWEGGDLVSVNSKDEEDFVKEQMGDKPFWIGLSNLNCDEDVCEFLEAGEKRLTWSDTAVTPTYANWDSHQDGSANVGSCAYINQGVHLSSQPGKWRYGSCQSSLAYMCKWSPDDCPDGWPCSYKDLGYGYRRVETSFCDSGEFLHKDSCYHFEGRNLTWKAAEDSCKKKEGLLASVHSLVDGQFLAAHRPLGWYSWLGLSQNNGNLEWRDGSSTDDVPLYLPTLPYTCSKLTSDGEVYMDTCETLRPSICQKGKARDSLPLLPAPTSASGKSAKCGWWQENPANDSFCYLINSKPSKTWKEARDKCARLSGNLLGITDLQEHAFIQGLLPNASSSVWLDASDTMVEDGSKKSEQSSPSSAQLAAAGNPGDPSGRRCNSLLGGKGGREVGNCEEKRGYVCKRRVIQTCDRTKGWRRSGSKCYKKMATTNGWLGARYDCVLEGGDLVSITSPYEEIFVKKQMGDKPFWIGRSNLKCNEAWCQLSEAGEKRLTGSDDTAVTPTYANWDSRQDRSADVGSCAYVNQGAHGGTQPGKWRHGSCGSSLAYMCERPLDACPEGRLCSYKDYGLGYHRVETSYCDNGDFLYKDSCYHFEGMVRPWAGAERFCQEWNGHLTSVLSWEERQFLAAHAPYVEGLQSWVGLKKNKGNFEWSDSTPAGNTEWVPNGPIGRGNCAALSQTGKLEDWPCTKNQPFICKKAKVQDFLHFLPPPGRSAKCGWWRERTSSDFCYLIQRRPTKVWKEARDDCRRRGGDLLSITDSHEQAFIQSLHTFLPSAPSLWLGVNNNITKDGSEWTDGSPFGYIVMDGDEPGDLSAASCLSFLTSNGRWKFDDCRKKRGYVCKKRGNTAKPPRPHDGFKETLVCNDRSADLVCEAEGQKQGRISIQSAFYGRRSWDVCLADGDSYNDEYCAVEGILPRYRKMCNSQQKCHIELLEDESCPASSSKYLQMVYSCEQKVCLDSLGIADGSVADSSFMASSSMEDATPEKARLNGESCWKPSKASIGSWIQVNLGYTRKVTGIVTQGCDGANTGSWNIHLEMKLSVNWRKWTEHPNGKFIGGGTHLLETPAFAQYVRILPLENLPQFGLRFDILGCAHDDETTCARTFNSLHVTDSMTFYCPPGCDKEEHFVFGLMVYSAGSHVCAAAIHAGVIRSDIGGNCIVMRAPKQQVYTGSTGNGITSRHLVDPLDVSHTFGDGEPRCSAPDWEEFAGFCYKTFEGKKNWDDAQLVCRSLGADLVSIHSEVEQASVKNVSNLETSDMWTGMNDLALAGTLVWSDRHEVTFTHWAAGEPSQRVGLGKHCVAVLRQTGRWKLMSCAQANSFMCKMPTAHFPIASPTPTIPVVSVPKAVADPSPMFAPGKSPSSKPQAAGGETLQRRPPSKSAKKKKKKKQQQEQQQQQQQQRVSCPDAM
ncbi:C-type mannose receptor 2-like [Syngnathus typhle]|uniref:C-type mannose receptor 2-like n=1 Tax=Syngnathus typhle TaxID=161592 RepID=UPI002A6A1635|nr:C-type mannose receptor 2-like [Syngnathus typhle]